MATITEPILLDSTGQAIKNSIDLLTANINRTADNIAYDSNLTIKGKIQAIDLTSGGNITGDLTVDRKNGTTAETGYGLIAIGNNKPEGTEENARGLLDLYGTTAYRARLVSGALTENRQIEIPDKGGTFALTSDIEEATFGRLYGLYVNSGNTSSFAFKLTYLSRYSIFIFGNFNGINAMGAILIDSSGSSIGHLIGSDNGGISTNLYPLTTTYDSTTQTVTVNGLPRTYSRATLVSPFRLETA